MSILRLSFKILLAIWSLNETGGFTIQPHISFVPNGFGHTQCTSPTSLFMAQRRGRPRGPVRVIEVKPPMNDEIKYDQLRVTMPGQSNSASTNNVKDEVLGILSREEALAKAKELGVDLILINENSDPPVAKIADYSKYRYEKAKKAKDAKKKSKSSELKEVKMSYKIDIHDYGVRIKNASKFINQGNRVKCTVQFKGREAQHDRLGYELLQKMGEDLTKICTMDGKPRREGRTLSCIFSPRPQVTKALNEKRRSEEKAKRKKKNKTKDKANASQKNKVDADMEETGTKDESPAGIIDSLKVVDEDEIDSSLKDLLGETDDLFA